MHFEDPLAPKPTDDDKEPWYRGLTSYHWFVLVVATLGWLFDTMDQQLFNLARMPAVRELIGGSTAPDFQSRVDFAGPMMTSIFLLGWGLGGLFFGVLGDKIGRAKTMMFTILIYSLCTGLSALSFGVWDFAFYRFLTALGVGGEFAVGVALVAEVMPERARVHALGWVQAFSAIGNMTAAMIAMGLGAFNITEGTGVSNWRIMFVVGALPALLALIIRARLKEPERWKAVAEAPGDTAESTDGHAQARLGSISELFSNPLLRRNTIVGMSLALAGIVGLWGIGFFSFDLFRVTFRPIFEREGLSPQAVDQKLTFWTGIISLVQNGGAFLGVHAFRKVTPYTGRKPAFFVAFLLAMFSTAFTFWFLDDLSDVFWMIPIMGFCQIALFGGYAIYFPELFPTRLRSTGTSFCYNVGRIVAAIGPLTLGYLTSSVFGEYAKLGPSMPYRYAGVSMCAFFLIGLIALPFAPETKDQPLPE